LLATFRDISVVHWQRTFTGTGPGGGVHKPQALITVISFAGALFGLVFGTRFGR
jgi:hypothetical protein